VPVQECPVVLNVELGGHAAVHLVGDTAMNQTGRLDNVLDLSAVTLGSLDDPVVFSRGGTCDPGVAVVHVSSNLLGDVLGGGAASDELVDGRGQDPDRELAVPGGFEVQRGRGIASRRSDDT